MYKIKTIIIEDEPFVRRRLEALCAKIVQLKVIGSYGCGREALELLNSGNVDLLLSDIKMPELDGISFVKSLPARPFVVFITAHPEFASEGFELDVVDYILKSLLSQERLLKAVQKVQNLLMLQRDDLMHTVLKFKDGHKIIFINRTDVYYFKAFGDYVQVITEKSIYTVSATLKELEGQLLWHEFVRIHRAYIINLTQIQSVAALKIQLKNGDVLDLGLQYRANFYSRIR